MLGKNKFILRWGCWTGILSGFGTLSGLASTPVTEPKPNYKQYL